MRTKILTAIDVAPIALGWSIIGKVDIIATAQSPLVPLGTTNTAPRLIDPPADAQPWEIQQADDALQSTIAQIQATLPIIQAEYDIRVKLKDMEFGNKIEWLQAQDQLVQQQHQIPVLEQHRDEATAAAAAAGLTQEYAATQAGYERDVLSDLDKTRGDVSDLGAELAKASRRLTLTTLTAPLDGTVQQLAIHTIGGVVTPAQPLMVIVPDQGGLIVEADVENKDVGFVHPGQRADVKIAAFTFTRYGLIEGTVLGLSRDVAMDSQPAPNPNDNQDDPEHNSNQPKEAGYVARIKLDRDWMDTETGRVALGPGMDVTAEIKTGRRRIIDYLLSPVAKYVMESGHER